MSEAKTQLPARPQNKSIREWLNSDAIKKRIAEAMPQHCTAEQLCGAALTALTKTPKLAQCTPESFMQAFMSLSQYGLKADGHDAHLIPYGNQVQLVIDYKGLVKLILNTGLVSSITTQVVCKDDAFKISMGQVVEHSYEITATRTDADVVAFYCIIRMKDGGSHHEIMTRGEVEAIRERSKAKSSGPWVTDWREMGKKTVFRRAAKWVPLTGDIQGAIENDYDAPQFEKMKPEPATAEQLEALFLPENVEAIQ